MPPNRRLLELFESALPDDLGYLTDFRRRSLCSQQPVIRRSTFYETLIRLICFLRVPRVPLIPILSATLRTHCSSRILLSRVFSAGHCCLRQLIAARGRPYRYASSRLSFQIGRTMTIVYGGTCHRAYGGAFQLAYGEAVFSRMGRLSVSHMTRLSMARMAKPVTSRMERSV
ncbi:hypothetical protein BD626DRAFT_245815 [Schizophyllum amplum]|uniref:Uncharacterized protein n=1 Tax=Schizophyllum amplum TaxID=97359 RepID=A0A550BVN3_9AGAR|nr:hypothetical protein BD626DRAFT_245815 [Auriculariopsis ampla]